MEAYKREFIQFLEGAGVLKFGDFTAKSGRKIPYFVNAGMIKTGDQITKMGEFYAKAYFDKLGKKEAVLYGPAYKGISLSISAAVALSKNGLNVPFFFNRKEVIVVRILKINYSSLFYFSLSVCFFYSYGNTITDKKILFLVYLKQRGGRKAAFEGFLCLGNLIVVNPRIEPFKSLPKITDKQYFIVAFSAECAVLA